MKTTNDYLKMYKGLSIKPGSVIKARQMVVDFIMYNEEINDKAVAQDILSKLIWEDIRSQNPTEARLSA